MLAEMDGWIWNYSGKVSPNLTYWGGKSGTPPLECISLRQLPNYLTFFDAIIPLIQKQDNGTKINICYLISKQRGDSNPWGEKDILDLMNATPSELCDALLKAKGYEV